jgi:hypothetical protein
VRLKGIPIDRIVGLEIARFETSGTSAAIFRKTSKRHYFGIVPQPVDDVGHAVDGRRLANVHEQEIRTFPYSARMSSFRSAIASLVGTMDAKVVIIGDHRFAVAQVKCPR